MAALIGGEFVVRRISSQRTATSTTNQQPARAKDGRSAPSGFHAAHRRGQAAHALAIRWASTVVLYFYPKADTPG